MNPLPVTEKDRLPISPDTLEGNGVGCCLVKSVSVGK